MSPDPAARVDALPDESALADVVCRLHVLDLARPDESCDRAAAPTFDALRRLLLADEPP